MIYTGICPKEKAIFKMFSRKKSQNQKWEEMPYGDYLTEVDDLLESQYGRTSIQEELTFIAECHEALCGPSECVQSLIFDSWVTREANRCY
jgi:hypothetical protein